MHFDAINHNDGYDALDINHAFKSGHDILKDIFTKRKRIQSLRVNGFKVTLREESLNLNGQYTRKCRLVLTSSLPSPIPPPCVSHEIHLPCPSSLIQSNLNLMVGDLVSLLLHLWFVRIHLAQLKSDLIKRFSFPPTAFDIIDTITLQNLKPPSTFADRHQRFKARYGYWVTEKWLHNWGYSTTPTYKVCL